MCGQRRLLDLSALRRLYASVTMYLDSATPAAANFLGVETLGLDDPLLPAPIKAAIFLAVGDLYANREAVATVPYYTNPTYERLLAPYRVMEV